MQKGTINYFNITRAIDKDFADALVEAKTLRDLRQKVRVLFDFIPTVSINFIYQMIARKVKIDLSYKLFIIYLFTLLERLSL
ncbi:MAG: hypothetical protein ACI976_002299 [Aureispira sp.]